MWFMRPFRADEWLLYDQSSPSASGGRALCQGKIFTRNGEMVAAVMQEGLTRYLRDYIPASRVNTPRVGVLALQGDTREHLAALREAGAEATTVRRQTELDGVDALVIPGGESTTMSHLLAEFELLEPLRRASPTACRCTEACAGMILLATDIVDAGAEGRRALPLRGIDMTVRRNAFGRQVDSFEEDIPFEGLDGPVHAVFIRAPWVERVGEGCRGAGPGRRSPRRGPAGPDAGHRVSPGDHRRPARAPAVRRHAHGARVIAHVTRATTLASGFCRLCRLVR